MNLSVAFYVAKGGLLNRLIRWWTGGVESHVELVVGFKKNGDMYCVSASAMDGGVRKKIISPKFGCWELVPVPWVDYDEALSLFDEEDGSGYDYYGIFASQVLPRGFHSKSRWFCSEFVAHCCGLKAPHRYSPHQLRIVLEDINGIRNA